MNVKKNNLKNITDLIAQLRETTCQVRDGKIGTASASTIFNGCGKILSSAKSLIEYNKMTKANSKIAFFEAGLEK